MKKVFLNGINNAVVDIDSIEAIEYKEPYYDICGFKKEGYIKVVMKNGQVDVKYDHSLGYYNSAFTKDLQDLKHNL